MVKDGTLNTLAIIGYAFACIFTVMAVVIGIYWGATGFKIKEKEIDALVFVAPENTDSEVITQNNTMNISTTEIQKIIGFSITGTENAAQDGEEASGGISKKIILTINNEYKNFKEDATDKTSIWFVEKDENGNPKKVVDKETNEEYYVKKETNRLVARVDEKIYIMLATTTYSDEKLREFFGEDADITDYQKDYIKGGLSYIHAKSADGLFSAKDLEVKVDIPVEAAKIVVEGYNYNGAKADLTEGIEKTQNVEYRHLITSQNALESFIQDFILHPGKYSLGTTFYYETTESDSNVYNDNVTYESEHFYTLRDNNGNINFVENTDLTYDVLQYFLQGTDLELSIKTFPGNAINPFSKTSKSFSFDLLSVSNDTATLTEEDGKNILKIDKSSANNSFTPGAITIQASVQGLLKDTTKTIPAKLVVQAAEAVAETIELKNKAINSIVVPVSNTSDNIVTEIHTCGNAENNTDYLDIEVIPKFYNGHNNPFKGNFSALTSRISNNHGNEEGQINVESLSESYRNAITYDRSENNITYLFTASRFLFGDEEINFQLSVNENFDEGKTITIPIIPTIIKPTSNDELVYDKSHNITITKYDKEFLSEVIGATVESDSVSTYPEKELNVVWANEEPNYTYAKWVYFLSTAKAKNENDAPAQTMDVDEGSEATELIAIKTTKEGQLVSKNGEDFNKIYVQNTGSVTISPKLVLCDKNGNPLNYKYNELNVDDDTGYILFNFDGTGGKHVTTFADLNIGDKDQDPYANCYVVLYDPNQNVSVNVSSQLEFAFFYNYADGKYSNLFKAEIDNTTFSQTIEVPADSTKRYVYAMANSSDMLEEIHYNGDKTLEVTIQDLLSSTKIDITDIEYISEEGAKHTGIKIPLSIGSNSGLDTFTAQVKLADNDTSFETFDGKSVDINVKANTGIFEEVNSLTPPNCLTLADVGKIVHYSEQPYVVSKSIIYDNKFAIGGQFYVIVHENGATNIYQGEKKTENAEPVATVGENDYFKLDNSSNISYHIVNDILETCETHSAGYYIVQEKSGETGVYEWATYSSAEGNVWWYNNTKEIKMRYARDSGNIIYFLKDYNATTNPVSSMEYKSCSDDDDKWSFHIPTKIYKTLNINKTPWNIDAQLNKTIGDEYEIVNYTGNGTLAFNTYSAVNISNPEHIKLRKQTIEDANHNTIEYLAIDLYEGWQSEISNLYLVYKTSVNGDLKAIDAYKLTFEDTNYIITDQTSNLQNKLTFTYDNNNGAQTLKLLDGNNEEIKNFTISDLIKLVDTSTSTNYELDPTKITAKLFKETRDVNNNVVLEDLSGYVTLSINASSGEIICEVTSDYEFNNTGNNVISTTDTLKLVFSMFSDNCTVFFVVEIDKVCNLSINVVQKSS